MAGASGPPGIRYVRSADGTSIGYLRLGRGPNLVIVPAVPFSNMTGDWGVPLLADVYRQLARDFELLLYDGRGTGASTREVEDLSTRAFADDIRAVLDGAGVERAALLAAYTAVPPAVTLAVENPERVSHLVLFGSGVRGHASGADPGARPLFSLIDEDWELFTQAAALDWMGWGAGETGALVAGSMRAATTPRIAKAALAAFGRVDLRDLLGHVRAESLVLHRRDGRRVRLEESAELAAALPRGRLHVLDGASATLFVEAPEETVRVLADFVLPDRATRHAARRVSGAPLSAREREVLRLIAAGDSNAEIAGRLGVSVHTVERHAANIYRKIDARGRADATGWALRNGLG